MVTALWFRSRALSAILPSNAKLALHSMLAVAYGQVALGIVTLLTAVPVHLGVTHQAGALTLLTTSLWLLHVLGPKRKMQLALQMGQQLATHTHTQQKLAPLAPLLLAGAPLGDGSLLADERAEEAKAASCGEDALVRAELI